MSRQTRSAAKKLTRIQLSTPPINPPPHSTVSSPLQTRLFANPQEWELYLTDNHLTNPSGLWLKIAKKSSPIPSITYDQALDTALCHGWIDGQRKALDETHFIQRFTPRRKGSLWSQPAGQAEIDAAREDGRWERAYSSSSNASVPDDFQRALDENKAAWDFFAGLGKTKKYAFIQRLETAKKPETRTKRIEQFVTLLASEKSL
ncbi:hypothetical protein NXS19_008055 [Fusarium pseudograminearum]|nr:hypothetical protein NXS19_008055 [Fusarium pseudograminearum]